MRGFKWHIYGILMLAIAACGKDPSGVRPQPIFHDPEILFHFFYHRDSAGGPLNTAPYPDTAVMRWYAGTPALPELAILLAQVEITGVDSTCAYFLVASGTAMYFRLGWKRHGATTMFSTIGPFNPTNPDDYDPYWDIAVSMDTLTGTFTSGGASSRTTSFCPIGMARDSITPVL
jgi:hypothetical protein